MTAGETIGECVARVRGLDAGLSYEVARRSCAPVARVVKASSSEVLGRFWWLLLLGFVAAVGVPLVVDWDRRNHRGRHTL